MMDSETPVSDTPKSEQSKASKTKAVLLFLLLVILVLASAVGGYLYRNQKAQQELTEKQTTITAQTKKIAELEAQLTDAQKTSDASGTATTASLADNIEAAITSGNTAALEGYMAPNVMVIIAASEGMGSRTPTQAVADVAYVKDAKTWDFNLDATTLNSYKSGFYKDYFKSNSVVGRANNGKVIVFNFDSQGKINGIFMAASDELLTQ